MTLQNIQIGIIIKNYKEMCLLLEEPTKTGCSKQYQMKNWERYFKYHREGKTSFVIDEVYVMEKPKEVKSDSIYTKIIELILMNKLSLSDNFSIEATKRNLYEMIGLANENFVNPEKKNETIHEFANHHSNKTIGCALPILSYKSSEFYCNDFFTLTNNRFDKILDDALKSMQKRDLISYNLGYKIVTLTNKNGMNFLDRRDANNEETKQIMEVKAEIRQAFPKFKMITSYNYQEYVDMVNQELNERYQWDSVYSVIKIIINEKYIRNNIPEVRDELEKECAKQKIELNMVAVDKFNEYFEKQYVRHQVKCFYELRDRIIENLKINVHNPQELEALSKLSEEEIADLMAECKNKDYKTYKKVYDKDYVCLQRELVGMFIKIENDKNNGDKKVDPD